MSNYLSTGICNVNDSAAALTRFVRHLANSTIERFDPRIYFQKRNCEPETVIASLTSFPARIAYTRPAIESILNQTVKADKVILYLVTDEFAGQDLPQEILALEKEHPDFEIHWWNTRTRSFTKLVPTLTEFPDATIITFDDDVIYAPDTIEKLMKTHRKYPKAICARRVKRITITCGGAIGEYNRWKRYKGRRIWLYGAHPKFKNLATACGGTLYPPHCLHPDVTNSDLFMTHCPTTDDLWFWAMAVLYGTKTVPAQRCTELKLIDESQAQALANVNTQGEMLNDKYLAKIFELFPVVKERITEK